MQRAYVTLVTNNGYCPGALVLAYSIRKCGSQTPIVCLVTPDVTDEWVERLEEIFQDVIKVPTLRSNDKRNLELLGRPDLDVTYTKFHLWRLDNYEKVIYMDADTYCLQSIDELFELDLTEDEGIAACADMGWPDCFNSGVMLAKPSSQTFERLLAFAQSNGSFDGGDQGTLNDYFPRWRRLPFGYNMTPGAVYSNAPAYKRYKDNVKVVHFAGTSKPWEYSRTAAGYVVANKSGSAHLAMLVNLWWQLHDIFVSGFVAGKEVYNKQVMMWNLRATPQAAVQAALDSHFPTKRAPSDFNNVADRDGNGNEAEANRGGARGHMIYHINYHVMDAAYKRSSRSLARSVAQQAEAARNARNLQQYGLGSAAYPANEWGRRRSVTNGRAFTLPPREDDDGPESFPIRLKAHALLPWEREAAQDVTADSTAPSSHRMTPIPAQFVYADTQELAAWTANNMNTKNSTKQTAPSSPMDIAQDGKKSIAAPVAQKGNNAKAVPSFDLERDSRPIWEQAAFPQFMPAPGYPEQWGTLDAPGAPPSLMEQASANTSTSTTINEQLSSSSKKLAPLPQKPSRPRKQSSNAQQHNTQGLTVPEDFANYRVDWSQQELEGIKLAPLDRSPSLRAVTPGAISASAAAYAAAESAAASEKVSVSKHQQANLDNADASKDHKSKKEDKKVEDKGDENADEEEDDGRPPIIFKSPQLAAAHGSKTPQTRALDSTELPLRKSREQLLAPAFISLDVPLPIESKEAEPMEAKKEIDAVNVASKPAAVAPKIASIDSKPAALTSQPAEVPSQSASSIANRIKMFNDIGGSKTPSPTNTENASASPTGDNKKWQMDLKKSNQALTLLSQAFQEATTRRSPSPVNMRIAEEASVDKKSDSKTSNDQTAVSPEMVTANASPTSQVLFGNRSRATTADEGSVGESDREYTTSNSASPEHDSATTKTGVEKESMPASKARSFFSRLSLRKKSIDTNKDGAKESKKDKSESKDDKKAASTSSSKVVRLSAR